MGKKETIQVVLKPRWNFIAKFYFVCIILFVLFASYVLIYRYIHKEEIINNIKNSSSYSESQEELENTIK